MLLTFSAFISSFFFFSSHKNYSFGNINLGAFFNTVMKCSARCNGGNRSALCWCVLTDTYNTESCPQKVSALSARILHIIGFFTAYGRMQKKLIFCNLSVNLQVASVEIPMGHTETLSIWQVIAFLHLFLAVLITGHIDRLNNSQPCLCSDKLVFPCVLLIPVSPEDPG